MKNTTKIINQNIWCSEHHTKKVSFRNTTQTRLTLWGLPVDTILSQLNLQYTLSMYFNKPQWRHL